jgi:hypothetical protein
MNKDQLLTFVAAEVDHRIAEFAERIAVQENKLAELERRVAISEREFGTLPLGRGGEQRSASA